MKTNYCSFNPVLLRNSLIGKLATISSLPLSTLESLIQKQIYSGGQFPNMPDTDKLIGENWYSRYCEFIMAQLTAEITGGALFEFAVIRTIQAYYGNKIDCIGQYRATIAQRIRPYSKIDIALKQPGDNGKVFALLEVKREIDTTLDTLIDYISDISICNGMPTAAIVFACYIDIENRYPDLPNNVFIDHLCKVEYLGNGKTEEAYRMNENAAESSGSPDFDKIGRYQEGFMEKLIAWINNVLIVGA